jgi:hypothetical protein
MKDGGEKLWASFLATVLEFTWLPKPRRSTCTLFKLHCVLSPSSSWGHLRLLYWSLVLGTGSLNRPLMTLSGILSTPRPCISGSVHHLSGIHWSKRSAPISSPLRPTSLVYFPILMNADCARRLFSSARAARKPSLRGMTTGRRSLLHTVEHHL